MPKHHAMPLVCSVDADLFTIGVNWFTDITRASQFGYVSAALQTALRRPFVNQLSLGVRTG
jgi:hypothetical protein